MQEKLAQPLPTRCFHWIQVLCVLTLLFTGIYFSYTGWLDVTLRSVRLVHFIFAYLFTINLGLYIYYNIITNLYKELVFLPKDVKDVPSFTKYILFLASKHPKYGKYNPGQKAIYTLWLVNFLVLIITGFALYSPQPFGVITRLVGGLSHLRTIHFAGTIVMVGTIPIHIYLALTEDPAKLQAIFTGYVQK